MEEPIEIYYWTSRGIIWHIKGCIVWYCEVSREIGGRKGDGGYPCLGRGTGGGTYLGWGYLPWLGGTYSWTPHHTTPRPPGPPTPPPPDPNGPTTHHPYHPLDPPPPLLDHKPHHPLDPHPHHPLDSPIPGPPTPPPDPPPHDPHHFLAEFCVQFWSLFHGQDT